MLSEILGSKTAGKILLHLFRYEETYGTAVSVDMRISLGQVQRQLDRFERCGLLVSKLTGKTRVYTFNKKSKYFKPFYELVKIEYESIDLLDRENLFPARRRPRKKDKPVIKVKL